MKLIDIGLKFVASAVYMVLIGVTVSGVFFRYVLNRVGFKIVLFSASAIRAAMKTLQEFYRALKRDRTTNGLLHTLVAFEERNRILGLPEIYDLEHRYAANISAPE